MPYINLYRSGWFHRQGKPNTYDAHPGDLYDTEEAAIADISPEARDLYIGTYPVLIDGFVGTVPHYNGHLVALNGSHSKPVPLAESRKAIREARAEVPRTPVLAEGVGLAIGGGSSDAPLETSEAEAVHLDPPNVVAFKAQRVTAASYKPTHGGYPG